MQIFYHGHSHVEIEAKFGSILIDPFISGNPSALRDVDWFLGKSIHTIILTHGHSDHLWDTVELAHKTECKIITTYELWAYLQKKCSLKDVHTMGIGGEFDFTDFRVKLTPAVHGGGIGEMDSGMYCTPAGAIIRVNWKNIYHAGDTALTYDMKLLWEYESIDLAFLPIWDNYTMGIDDAVKAVEFINPKQVVPIHYNTLPLIQVKPEEFVYKVGERARLMNAGEYIEFLEGDEHIQKI